jgi:hypothetical protein
MPYENTQSTKSIVADVSLATNQFCFVRLNPANARLTLAVPGGVAIGVLQDKPGAGDPGLVCGPGDISKVIAGATIAASQFVTGDNLGRAVVAATAQPFLGIALNNSTAAGSLIDIIFQPSGFQAP